MGWGVGVGGVGMFNSSYKTRANFTSRNLSCSIRHIHTLHHPSQLIAHVIGSVYGLPRLDGDPLYLLMKGGLGTCMYSSD